MTLGAERVIVMAHGEGARWSQPRGRSGLPEYKQMATLASGGPTILGRTVHMLTQADLISSTFLVAPEQMRPAAGEAFLTGVTDPTSLLSAIQNTRPMWGTEWTIILLGDVVFSHRSLRMLTEPLESMRFVGRRGANTVTGKAASELFGVVFAASEADRISEFCLRVATRGAPILYPPKLWALARLACGLEHDDAEGPLGLLVNPQDYTDDVDSPEEHDDFLPALANAAKADDMENDPQWKQIWLT